MTLLGKLLVMFNLAVAVMLSAIAFVAWSSSVDWTDSKEKGGVPKGEFAKRAVKLDALWKGEAPAQAGWTSERARLTKSEKHLAVERVWYDGELRYVRVGPAKGNGVRVAAIADKDDAKAGVKKGQVLLDNQGFPQLVQPKDGKGNPLLLLSLAEYNNANDDALKQLARYRDTHQKQIQEAIDKTIELIGDKTKGTRGLHARIADEKVKIQEMSDELKLVEPRYINTMVEKQLIDKRHTQLLRRIDELKKIKVVSDASRKRR